MESGLSINKHIYQLLSSDEELEALVGKNIFPLVAEESVKFPFVIFTKTSLNTDYNKCGVTSDTVTFSVAIAAVNYFQTVEIAERVRQILELYHDDYFARLEMAGVSESFMDNSYIHTLDFTAKLLLN